jgi:hypothetical protein
MTPWGDALFSLTLFAHNWLCRLIDLRLRPAERADGRRSDQRTPAITLGLAGHLWT